MVSQTVSSVADACAGGVAPILHVCFVGYIAVFFQVIEDSSSCYALARRHQDWKIETLTSVSSNYVFDVGDQLFRCALSAMMCLRWFGPRVGFGFVRGSILRNTLR